ncbi:P-loop containing nucleoside triphosphate hydrolase protein [Boletus edulis BED1]|uniref:DNA 3'-5' helicase n=1 Tax=Boletus edulis BED1 TaxID=1328754 RepID=A0AAD4C7B1_BOLED|nr:P-loop containing nucleoside triphosphate hydrolase protein [Boletus edulis BED1]
MTFQTPSIEEIRGRTLEVFNRQPCLWQARVAEAILQGNKDVVCVAGTSMGKTLTFWIPLLFRRPDGIQIVVTPLNQLGQQQVENLESMGMRAIAINADTANEKNYEDIEKLTYQAIIISPEQLMKPGGRFEGLLRKKTFTKHIIAMIFDEAHCIMTWGKFRPEYKELGRLRFIIAQRVPYLITSATLTSETLRSIMKVLDPHRKEEPKSIRTYTDRPNIKICVRKIKYPLTSYTDLMFLVPEDWKPGDPAPPKFLIFFDDIQDSIGAAKAIQRRLPHEYRERIAWFNSDMTTEYKESQITRLHAGEIWGLCTTESFGMGMDVPDIAIVIQWKATCRLTELWQRWGRAARAREETGTAILFAEKDLFDDVREEKRSRQEAKKRRREDTLIDSEQPPLKRVSPSINTAAGAESSNGRGGGKRVKKELDPAMDCLINADRQGLLCRRKVIEIYFESKGAGEFPIVDDAENFPLISS